MRVLVAGLLIILVALPGTAGGQNVCVKSACFSPSAAVGGKDLPLRGAGLFTYLFFDIYSGAFYADPTVSSPEEALSPVPKRLELQYHRELTRENFIESSEEMLKDNPKVEIEKIRKGLQKLYSLYKDVSKGDRYALEYVPEKGTTLYLNDVPQGTIEGEDFQRAYFSIWISDYSVSDRFTSELLGAGTE